MKTLITPYLPADSAAAAAAALTPVSGSMKGSRILGIAAEVRALQAEGREIANFTVGDFKPAQFRIPDGLTTAINTAVSEGETNYPPADGLPVLKQAIADLVSREWGLDYGPESICVGSGARPPIYAAWRLFVEPGDKTVSFLPMWNVGYYAHLCQSDHHFVQTAPDTDFFPTVEAFREAIRGARLVLINSPLNPTGTMIDPEVLAGIAQALVDENKGRERPCMLVYDQVYWMLGLGERPHSNPVALVPECAPYVIHIDAISKWTAGTGLRVGWAVLPPYLQTPMKALIGHMGAWAPRPVQLGLARWMSDVDGLHSWAAELRSQVSARLDRLYAGISAMQQRGLPVRAIAPQGGIYLSFHVGLIGNGFDTNEEIRRFLLEKAGVAVVPFQAFDMPEETGWFRMSVGAVGLDDIDGALARLEAAFG